MRKPAQIGRNLPRFGRSRTICAVKLSDPFADIPTMLRTRRRVTVGLISLALIAPAGLLATAFPSAALPTQVATSANASSSSAPQVRKAKKKVRCVVVKKRVAGKVKKVKKCKKVSKKKTTSSVPTSPLAPAAVLAVPPSSLLQTPAPSGQSVMPTAATTGVPAGTVLTPYNGDLTITTPGTVVDSLDIHGFVVVKAPNVTIRRSIIRGGAAPTVGKGLLSVVTAGATNYLIEDVTVVPSNPSPYFNGVNVNQAGTFRRMNISGSVDGMMIYGSGVNVLDSYFHDFRHYLSDPNWNGGPSHDDAIQVQAGIGINIVGNRLEGAFNSAVMITQDAGTTNALAINGNWIDYGGCSINYGSTGAYKTGMQANNNRFGRAQRIAGCAIIHNAAKSDLAPSGNVWSDTGLPTGVKQGS